jgi:hypothetical protein
MKFEYREDTIHLEKLFTIVVPFSDLLKAKLSIPDRLLFEECEKSKKISDKLLALEIIAERVESSEE